MINCLAEFIVLKKKKEIYSQSFIWSSNGEKRTEIKISV